MQKNEQRCIAEEEKALGYFRNADVENLGGNYKRKQKGDLQVSREDLDSWQGPVVSEEHGKMPSRMVGCRFFPTFSCKHATLPSLTCTERALVFICLLFPMCFSSQSMFKYNVYYLYFLFYVLYKFGVVFCGVFFPNSPKSVFLLLLLN